MDTHQRHKEEITPIVIPVNFELARACLADDPLWGARVLELAGHSTFRTGFVRKISRGVFSSKIIAENDHCFIAWGVIGQKSFLAYRIQPQQPGQISIMPLAYFEQTRKIAVAAVLLLLYILPVLLAPFIWWVYERRILNASQHYLKSFCQYLQLNEGEL
jgi:hypothetical protein